MSQLVAIVVSEVFLRRLIIPLTYQIKGNYTVRIIDIHRPIEEILLKLDEMRPVALITEWLSGFTDRLLGTGLPTVISDTDFLYPNATSIDVDDQKVGCEAAHYFLGSGYKHFACLGNQTPYSRQRMHGFEQELARHGIEARTREEIEQSNIYYMESWQQQRRDLEHWLQSLPRPTALFAVHDPLGLAVCESIQHAGLKTPEDISVLGVNDDELLCHLAHPSLSSVSIPWSRLAEEVSYALSELLATGKPRKECTLISPGAVVSRRSTDLVATQNPLLRRCLHYLRENYREPINITILCSDLRLSRRTVERCFIDKLKRSPAQMLTQIRVDAVKQMLQKSTLPIGHIAELTGFSNAERLAVTFKKSSGMRPSDFRKSRPLKNQ